MAEKTKAQKVILTSPRSHHQEEDDLIFLDLSSSLLSLPSPAACRLMGYSRAHLGPFPDDHLFPSHWFCFPTETPVTMLNCEILGAQTMGAEPALLWVISANSQALDFTQGWNRDSDQNRLRCQVHGNEIYIFTNASPTSSNQILHGPH